MEAPVIALVAACQTAWRCARQVRCRSSQLVFRLVLTGVQTPPQHLLLHLRGQRQRHLQHPPQHLGYANSRQGRTITAPTSRKSSRCPARKIAAIIAHRMRTVLDSLFFRTVTCATPRVPSTRTLPIRIVTVEIWEVLHRQRPHHPHRHLDLLDLLDHVVPSKGRALWRSTGD